MKNLLTFEEFINEDANSYYDSEYNLEWDDYDARIFMYYKRKFMISDKPTYHRAYMLYKKGIDTLRSDLKNPGRLWLDREIIAFWEYPKTLRVLKLIAEDIKKAININVMDPKWKIMIKTDKLDVYRDSIYTLIPTNDFRGSEDLTEKEFNKNHVISPLKKKKGIFPSGFGSEKGGQMKKFQSRYTSENKNDI